MAESGQFRVARITLWTIASLLLLSLIMPTCARIAEKGYQVKGLSNCKQVITTLKLYSSDNDGAYPDSDTDSRPTTANEAFRLLFVGGQCNNEMIFGCPSSPFNGDGKTGPVGAHTEAVKAGENHWAMTKGLTDSSPGDIPLAFENAVVLSWPPQWMAGNAPPRRSGRGRLDGTQLFQWAMPGSSYEPIWMRGKAWPGNKIIIGLNDSSVSLLPLKEVHGDTATFYADASVFDMTQIPGAKATYDMLNVEPLPGSATVAKIDSGAIDWEWHLVTWGHVLIGVVLPALLFLGWGRISGKGGSMLRVFAITAVVWYGLNVYRLAVQGPAYVRHAVGHDVGAFDLLPGDNLVFAWGWVEPLVVCVVLSFLKRGGSSHGKLEREPSRH